MDFIEMLVGGILQALLSKSEKAQEIICILRLDSATFSEIQST